MATKARIQNDERKQLMATHIESNVDDRRPTDVWTAAVIVAKGMAATLSSAMRAKTVRTVPFPRRMAAARK